VAKLKERIIALIRELHPYEQIDEDAELIESGILDSLSILGLITELEDEFGIEIADDSVTVKNFKTVLEIVRLVEKAGNAN